MIIIIFELLKQGQQYLCEFNIQRCFLCAANKKERYF